MLGGKVDRRTVSTCQPISSACTVSGCSERRRVRCLPCAHSAGSQLVPWYPSHGHVVYRSNEVSHDHLRVGVNTDGFACAGAACMNERMEEAYHDGARQPTRARAHGERAAVTPTQRDGTRAARDQRQCCRRRASEGCRSEASGTINTWARTLKSPRTSGAKPTSHDRCRVG